MTQSVLVVFDGDRHDHAACVNSALAEAERVAKDARKPLRGARLAVLKALLQSHKPYGAYGLKDVLANEGLNLRPIQIYRALDALTALGLVHRVESRNAFIACMSGPVCREPQLLICSSCGQVAELGDDAVDAVIKVAVARTGFEIGHAKVELFGICRDCQAAKAAA
jgi:Fur family zinc uptake transcriptional regulator